MANAVGKILPIKDQRPGTNPPSLGNPTPGPGIRPPRLSNPITVNPIIGNPSTGGKVPPIRDQMPKPGLGKPISGPGLTQPMPIRPGKPTPIGGMEPGKVYAGGSANFDERTGKYRTPLMTPPNKAQNPNRVINASMGGY